MHRQYIVHSCFRMRWVAECLRLSIEASFVVYVCWRVAVKYTSTHKLDSYAPRQTCLLNASFDKVELFASVVETNGHAKHGSRLPLKCIHLNRLPL